MPRPSPAPSPAPATVAGAPDPSPGASPLARLRSALSFLDGVRLDAADSLATRAAAYAVAVRVGKYAERIAEALKPGLLAEIQPGPDGAILTPHGKIAVVAAGTATVRDAAALDAAARAAGLDPDAFVKVQARAASLRVT